MIAGVNQSQNTYVPARASTASQLMDSPPPGVAGDSVELASVAGEDLSVSNTPGVDNDGSSGWVKAGTTALLALAGIGALAATATPAQAQTSVGIHVGPGGWGVTIQDGHHHHGHGRHGHGHHGHGRHGHGHHDHHRRGPGWGHRGPGWGHGGHYDNHGPFYTNVGVDGRIHRFDRFGHVNDASGHYRMWVDGWGNVRYDFNVHHH